MQVKNFEIYRGDQRTITWQVTEDFTGKTLLFGVKASKLLDAIRLIEITPVYNNGMITVIINAVDTENILQQRLYYDLINVTDNTTIATGTLYLIADVITKVDGYAQGKIDDNLISNLSVWSSEKTNNEIQTEANLRTTADANLQSQVTTLQASSHTHTNKTLLDTYNQTNVDISDAVAKKHNHANQTILDNTSDSFTTVLRTNYDNHLANINNPHAVNAAQVGLGNVTNDAQLKRASGDFNSFVEQTAINDNDIYLIEDSINGYIKKKTTNASIIKSTRIIKATETTLPTGTDIALVNNNGQAAIKDANYTIGVTLQQIRNTTSIGFGVGAGQYIADGITPLTTTSQSIYLGYGAKALADNSSNEIVIGYNAIGNGSNSVTLGNDSITKTILKGNVGIGREPQTNLDVAGAGRFSNILTIQRGIDGNVTNLVINSGIANTNALQINTDQPNAIVSFNARNNYVFAFQMNDLEKMRILPNGYVGFFTTSPTATVDINGSTGYNQLRLRTSYTPTSSADANGNTGDIAWDDNYVYVKTSAGWKRSALTTF